MKTIDPFRSVAVTTQYTELIKKGYLEHECPLCSKLAVIDFSLWKVVENSFPYDKIAEIHHMLIPKRHVTEAGLTNEERLELLEIKSTSLLKYEFILEALPHNKSIPNHFHLHLIVPKFIAEEQAPKRQQKTSKQKGVAAE